MSISKKKRFEVFKRDGFVCQYCGSSPPAVILECDHIDPKSNGGSDDIDNLICACFDCNRGKSSGLLSDIPESVSLRIERAQEKEEQLKQLQKLKRQVEKQKNKAVDSLERIFQTQYPNKEFTQAFRVSVKSKFLANLDTFDVSEAMEIAVNRGSESNEALKYFCGICWNKIKKRSAF